METPGRARSQVFGVRMKVETIFVFLHSITSPHACLGVSNTLLSARSRTADPLRHSTSSEVCRVCQGREDCFPLPNNLNTDAFASFVETDSNTSGRDEPQRSCEVTDQTGRSRASIACWQVLSSLPRALCSLAFVSKL